MREHLRQADLLEAKARYPARERQPPLRLDWRWIQQPAAPKVECLPALAPMAECLRAPVWRELRTQRPRWARGFPAHLWARDFLEQRHRQESAQERHQVEPLQVLGAFRGQRHRQESAQARHQVEPFQVRAAFLGQHRRQESARQALPVQGAHFPPAPLLLALEHPEHFHQAPAHLAHFLPELAVTRGPQVPEWDRWALAFPVHQDSQALAAFPADRAQWPSR